METPPFCGSLHWPPQFPIVTLSKLFSCSRDLDADTFEEAVGGPYLAFYSLGVNHGPE